MSAGDPDPEFAALVTKIARERGLDCEAYKSSCLRRRIAVRMRARGVDSYGRYAGILDRDPDEYDRLLDALTINVSKFFRNGEMWRALEEQVLPAIWPDENGELACWSAGCASGEEPYTLAILLVEYARRRGRDTPAIRIDATDLDRGSLIRAEEAVYGEQALDETPDDIRRRYFGDGPPYRVPPEVRALVRFRHHDILRDPPPAPPYDLILCRNVVIYFDRPSQDRLFLRLIDGIRPKGFLVLGKVEILFGEARDRLRLENPRERIYRRP